MKNTMRANLLGFLLLLCLPAWAWSQVISDGVPATMPMSASPGAGMESSLAGGYLPSSVVQASYCGDCGMPGAECGCGADACTGACGGVCSGGCGKSGFLSGGLLGGGLGNSGMGLMTGGGWFEAEYLLWWSDDRHIPALATQSPAGTPTNVAGQLGQPSTAILFGNEMIDTNPNSGFRISLGTWLDKWQSIGIGSRYFWVSGEEDFSASSGGDPILARPFFNTTTNLQDALILAEPGVVSGSLNVTAETTATGSDIFLRKLLLSGYCNRFDLIGGYSRSTIEDSITIRDSLTAIDASRAPIGTVIDSRDYFEVMNTFHGGFIGFMAESADGPLSWSTFAKVAFGSMDQEARISGSSTTTVPGAGSASNPFGLLALPSNIGRFEQEEFAIVPELNVSVRYNVSQNFQVMVGYSFIYWTDVALAGDIIDLNVNPTPINGNLVGAGAPTQPELQSDGFWYTGVSFGGVFRY